MCRCSFANTVPWYFKMTTPAHALPWYFRITTSAQRNAMVSRWWTWIGLYIKFSHCCIWYVVIIWFRYWFNKWLPSSQYLNQYWHIISGTVRNLTLIVILWNVEAIFFIPQSVNPLWPMIPIWGHRSGSTLALVMSCCLTAPSHYLNQCRLIIS